MLVVSDTSPIRALAHLGLIHLLRELYTTVAAPPAVLAELETATGRFAPLDARVWPFVRAVKPGDAVRVRELEEQLDLGEAEAIALALELHADALLIDEKRGRTLAKGLGISVIGTVGVLGEAKRAGLIREVRPLLGRLVSEIGFFLDDRLMAELLEQLDGL